jgi:hypothetical protein
VLPGIHLNSLGLFDMDAVEDVPSNGDLLHTLRESGAQHLPVPDNAEHAYGVKVGTGFLNEYQARMYRRAYPHLFPYGHGCPDEGDGVSLVEYFRWAMRYADGRFRKDKHFFFDLFGIQQKREVSRSARLTVRRKNWNHISSELGLITDSDIQQAIEEESAKKPVSNVALSNFLRAATITRASVVGSDASRFRFRSQIWGTSIVLGNPSLFLTINLSDHHDPIAQFLAGEDIDLDKFCSALGPSQEERSRNISADPFAAAQYFNVVVAAILEHLVGIKIEQNKVHSVPGVLGLIDSYFGMVEAQGRGNLHIHLLLWIANTPDANEMKTLLATAEFRSRLETYIKHTIHAHAEGVTVNGCLGPNPRPHPAYSRPPDPNSLSFLADIKEAERLHVESSQYHTCKPPPNGCQRVNRFGVVRCKRHAPFTLSDRVHVEPNGQYKVWDFRYSKRQNMSLNVFQVIRHLPFVNGYNPWIHSYTTRSNGDLKFITNGSDTKDAAWYITTYSTKNQGSTHNLSSILARVKSHIISDVTDPAQDVRSAADSLLVRFTNAINSRQEISAPMAIASMEGWGPSYSSHLPKKVFLADVHRVLRTYILVGKHPLQREHET